MQIAVLALAGALVLFLLVRICAFLLRRAKFSLRTLLIAVTVVAILLASILGYRRASMAQLRWLDPSTTEAVAIFPAPTIRERDDEGVEFRYYARNRDVQRLLPTVNNGGYSVGEEELTVFTRSVPHGKEVLKKHLKAIETADVLPQGSFVIRGRVRDNTGQPIANAHVDILGGFVFINCWRTRHDGTFTMALTDENSAVPAGSGYYFRIRHPAETAKNHMRWHSRYFKLDPNNPEMVADIVLP